MHSVCDSMLAGISSHYFVVMIVTRHAGLSFLQQQKDASKMCEHLVLCPFESNAYVMCLLVIS